MVKNMSGESEFFGEKGLPEIDCHILRKNTKNIKILLYLAGYFWYEFIRRRQVLSFKPCRFIIIFIH